MSKKLYIARREEGDGTLYAIVQQIKVHKALPNV
jgi:hypothetical protein